MAVNTPSDAVGKVLDSFYSEFPTVIYGHANQIAILLAAFMAFRWVLRRFRSAIK